MTDQIKMMFIDKNTGMKLTVNQQQYNVLFDKDAPYLEVKPNGVVKCLRPYYYGKSRRVANVLFYANAGRLRTAEMPKMSGKPYLSVTV